MIEKLREGITQAICLLISVGIASGMNFYAFAAGNPISFVDPSGLGAREAGFSWVSGQIDQIRAMQDDARIHGSPAGTLTGGQALSGALNMIPYVSTAKAFIEMNTGKDLITGQRSDRSDFSLASQAVLGAIILPPARAATPGAYSVAFEMQLGRTQLGLRGERHFEIANEALRAERAVNPALAEIAPAPHAVGRPPSGWSWHHATIEQGRGEMGIMQLVPDYQHQPGSPWRPLLHHLPRGAGGYIQWAVPNGAPPRR